MFTSKSSTYNEIPHKDNPVCDWSTVSHVIILELRVAQI